MKFGGVHVVQSLVFYVMFCRCCFFFWSLYCQSFFNLRVL